MIAKLLTRWVWPDDRASQDDDGACPACDHPFGHLNHICFGPLTMPAKKRSLTPHR